MIDSESDRCRDGLTVACEETVEGGRSADDDDRWRREDFTLKDDLGEGGDAKLSDNETVEEAEK
jgi:hypothetical protein